MPAWEADCVNVCVSETTHFEGIERALFTASLTKKAVVIHNCVTIHVNELRQPMLTPYPFFLMVAQHRANKNIPLALEAFEELLQEKQIDARTSLFLVGNHGPETETIKSVLSRRAHRESVKLVDRVSGPTVEMAL